MIPQRYLIMTASIIFLRDDLSSFVPICSPKSSSPGKVPRERSRLETTLSRGWKGHARPKHVREWRRNIFLPIRTPRVNFLRTLDGRTYFPARIFPIPGDVGVDEVDAGLLEEQQRIAPRGPPSPEHVACRKPRDAHDTSRGHISAREKHATRGWPKFHGPAHPPPLDGVHVWFRVRRSGTRARREIREGSHADGVAQSRVIAPWQRERRRSERKRAHARGREGGAPRETGSLGVHGAARDISAEKYWRPRERGGARPTVVATASRRGYVPSWMLPDCRRPGPYNTCTNYGGLPRKEQARRREPERRLLCVKRAPRCGGARVCALAPRPRAANARRAARAPHATRSNRPARTWGPIGSPAPISAGYSFVDLWLKFLDWHQQMECHLVARNVTAARI